MEKKKELKLFLYFTVIYLIIFAILAIKNKNYEFLYYILVLCFILLGIILYHKQMHLSIILALGLTLVGLMHMTGGNIHINGLRLYDVWLIPNLLRYDHLAHFVGLFVATFVVYNLLNPHLDRKIKTNKILLFLLLVLLTSGVGALNEILELGAVAFLNAGEAVGDYMNNALDLLFNLLGAIAASFFLVRYHGKIQKNID